MSSNGVENDPSPPTGTVTWAGGRGVALALAGLPPVDEPLAPAYVALTTTWLAFFAVPETGIAPFWKLAPSAGESIVRSGAWTTEYGTLMMIWTCLSEFFSVSGSVAETVKSFRPRRRGTTWLHVPSVPAEMCSCWPLPSAMLTVAPGTVVPRSV